MFIKPKLAIEDFDYPLPDTQIAYTPALNRAESKLLVWNQSIIAESRYAHIDDFIPAQSTLLFNNSKVIAARLLFDKPSTKVLNEFSDTTIVKQSNIEIFCLEPTAQYTPVLLAMQATGKCEWTCLVGGAKKWKDDVLYKKIQINNNSIIFSAKKMSQAEGKFIIEFSWDNANFTFSEILNCIGLIPLPPYIQRKANESDKDRYQTTYAVEEGSVAAPTAGLHFSNEVFERLNKKNIYQQYITLHVGAGTFMPVKSETIDAHEMHAEFIEVDFSVIQYLMEQKKGNHPPVIAVGTTSLRTMESLYWMGVKAFLFEQQHRKSISINELQLGQWDAYELATNNITVQVALNALLVALEKQQCTKLISKTQLMVTPGYTFKICDALVTNFHQPKSTLLLIIAAIVGEKWKEVYAHALKHDYRFLSYGDGCLFWIKQPAA
jgi:S-adenosylmethionine:tRNA ribosyltransferase-isomerase